MEKTVQNDNRGVVRRTLVVALAAVALSLAAGRWSAAAALSEGGSCVRLDSARDTLAPDEQRAAAALFEQALLKEGRPLAQEDCREEWVVFHLRLGDRITVVVASPFGRRSDEVSGVADLPAQYSQSIRALLRGREPSDEASGVVDRTNVTSAQTAARRVPTESLFVLRMGYGYASAPGDGAGPFLGCSWRKELNRFALDIGFANLLMLTTDSFAEDDQLVAGPFSPVTLGVTYNFRPTASATPYVGAGLGLTGWDTLQDTEGIALDLRVSIGYEMLRASNMRLFVQADGSVALNHVRRWVYDGQLRHRPVVAVLSLGVGFGGRGEN